MNAVLENILKRRSVRAYDETQIKSEELQDILKAATYAPSGMNNQTWLFTVVQNKEILNRLNDAVKEVLKTNNVNPHLTIDDKYKFYYNAPTIIIVSNKKDYRNGMADSAAAIENILLAATSLNISSCWVNQLTLANSEDKNVRQILKEINIPDDHVVYGTVALGYSSITPEAPERKANTINIIK